jgi:hypothetical protein
MDFHHWESIMYDVIVRAPSNKANRAAKIQIRLKRFVGLRGNSFTAMYPLLRPDY